MKLRDKKTGVLHFMGFRRRVHERVLQSFEELLRAGKPKTHFLIPVSIVALVSTNIIGN